MRGEDCKNSWEMCELIDGLQQYYSIDNEDLDNTLYGIDNFINEVRREISEYGGDRKGRIHDYFTDCIQELLRKYIDIVEKD
ncbi:MAG: hypothetical protein ISQ95_01075 [Flavobacteriales bacterium]|nr:hypothetical protein [Flavobacteriales bacterium]